MRKKFIETFKESIGKTFGRLTVLGSELRMSEDKKIYFVKCQCSCGKEKFINFHAMKRGGILSCGCLLTDRDFGGGKALTEWTKKHGNSNKKPFGEASFNALYGQYVYGAKTRNIEFLLTKEEFGGITKMRCHYCNSEPKGALKLKGLNGHYIYNGIDRKDNNLGYTIDNSLPCCSICNYLKRSSSYNDFIGHINKIHQHLNNAPINN